VDRYDWGSQNIQDEIKIKFSPNTQTPSNKNIFGLKPMDEIPRFESHSNDVMIQCAFTQYSLKQGLKVFPVEARDATIAEIRQLHEMQFLQPVHKFSLTNQEFLRVLNSITFIKQKSCGKIKTRTSADGRPQQAIFEIWEATTNRINITDVSSRCLQKPSHCCLRYTRSVPAFHTNRRCTYETYRRNDGFLSMRRFINILGIRHH
jgi:hypothetical protein